MVQQDVVTMYFFLRNTHFHWRKEQNNRQQGLPAGLFQLLSIRQMLNHPVNDCVWYQNVNKWNTEEANKESG